MSRPALLAIIGLAGVALGSCAGCRGKSVPDAGTGPSASRQWLEGEVPGEAAQGEPVPGGTLTVRALFEPAGLNCLHDSFRDAWAMRMTRGTLFETLIELDPVSYQVRPLLATRWVEGADQLTHTFTLRQGVTFHDGRPFSSADVAAVLEAVMDPKRATSSIRAELADLETFRALDEWTVELRWKRPSPLGFRALTRLPLYPAHALEGDFDALALSRAPLGTGPFQFGKWETGASIALVRNEAYWGQAAPLQGIVFRIVKDHTVASQLFERGEFDLMTFVQPQLWRAMEAPGPANAWAVSGYHRLKALDNSFSYIAWNSARPQFADPRVRRALAKLYPAELISRNVDLGLEVSTTCPYWLRGPYCDPAVRPIAYDAAGARALLAEAGWKDADGDGVLEKGGVAFRFTFLLSPSSVRLGKLAPLLQQELSRVGIAMELEKVEPSVLSQRVRTRQFDAVSRVWTEFDVEQDLSELFHSAQIASGANIAGYVNPKADQLLEQFRGEGDPARRVEAGRQLHRLLYADQPFLFMTARVGLDAAKRRVRGLSPSLLWYDLRRVWVAP